MRVVAQRVSQARVEVDGKEPAQIKKGLLVYLGIEEGDNLSDVEWLSKKLINLRLFADDDGKMNISLLDSSGEILLVSQFTLFASTKKGNRPSFIRAARPEKAIPLYEQFKTELTRVMPCKVKTGYFGAEMSVTSQNDGPVTLIIDSKNRE